MPVEVKEELMNVMDGTSKALSGLTKLAFAGITTMYDFIKEKNEQKKVESKKIDPTEV